MQSGPHPVLVCLQVVLLGAGMDTRAWRLHCWAPGTHIFEVDSPSMSSFKQQVMAGLKPSCTMMSFVVADARDLDHLERQLLEAGFTAAATASYSSFPPPSPVAAGVSKAAAAAAPAAVTTEPAAAAGVTERATAVAIKNAAAAAAGADVNFKRDQHRSAGDAGGGLVCTLWLLEGFIGYLTREEAAALLRWMAGVSAPGSVLLLTAPARPKDQREQQEKEGGEGSVQQQSRQQAADQQEEFACIGGDAPAAGGDGDAPAAGGGGDAPAAGGGGDAPAAGGGGDAPAASRDGDAPAAASGGGDALAAAGGGDGSSAIPLYHVVFEEVEETAARVEAAGWRLMELAMEDNLAKEYETERAARPGHYSIIKATVA